MADRRQLKPKAVLPAVLFRKCFCPVPDEKTPITIDLRPQKDFKKLHIALTFNCIVSKNGKVRDTLTHNEACSTLRAATLMMTAKSRGLTFRDQTQAQ